MEAEVGMLVVETIAKIRRAYFVHGQPIKAICRELGVSRKVVRKVIRSEATEFRYERETQPLPKMGPWSAELDRLLAANESKAARERLTLIRLFEELRGLGYAGGYDAVRRYARRWSREHGASTVSAYVPLSFAPGEAYQFDWSHEVVLLSGTTVVVKAAHVRLCHSRMLFVRASQATGATQKMFARDPSARSLYWQGLRDRNGAFLDGGKTYKLSVPQPVPQKLFWSVTLYDPKTRSQIRTDQNKAALRSMFELKDVPKTGNTELFFGPAAPAGKEGQWLKTNPGQGWFAYFRLYGPEGPAFDGSWRPGDFEAVT